MFGVHLVVKPAVIVPGDAFDAVEPWGGLAQVDAMRVALIVEPLDLSLRGGLQQMVGPTTRWPS